MGFTPTPYDATAGALDHTYAFISANADLIAHLLDKGVPWPEAYDQRPYPDAVEQDLRYRGLKRRSGQRLMVAISPIGPTGDRLGGYWGARGNMPRPGAWARRDFDDPQVISAYTNYASRIIRRLRPDFFAYGVEVNGLIKTAPAEWPKFVTFARFVYKALKAEHPELPIFVSLQLDDFWSDAAAERKAIAAIMPYTDYVAVSAYPYVQGYRDPRTLPREYFAGLASSAPHKPFAVAGTGFTAQDVVVQGTVIRGRADWQDGYARFMLSESQRLGAKFVVWFVPRDYDALISRLTASHAPAHTLELYGLWRSTGLLDAAGSPRRAMQTWKDWLARTRE